MQWKKVLFSPRDQHSTVTQCNHTLEKWRKKMNDIHTSACKRFENGKIKRKKTVRKENSKVSSAHAKR